MPDSQHVTLVASTVNTVTLNSHYEHLEVVNVDGAAAVYFTVGGAGNVPTDPTVAGAGTLVLPAVIGGVELDGAYFENGVSVVKLISSGIPKVNVRGW